MSYSYGKFWIATKEDLKNVLLREKLLPLMQPTKDRSTAHRIISNMYARYIVLCNNLADIFDQTLNVQKRIVVEQILLQCTNRLLELQGEMCSIELSEFIYCDDALLELKLTTQNIEFLRPFYYPYKREISVQETIDEIPQADEQIVIESLKGFNKHRKVLTVEEIEIERKKKQHKDAIKAIKCHEKAKQARIRQLNIKLFPQRYKPKPYRVDTELTYQFHHHVDQAPLIKIKRTKFQSNFYQELVKLDKVTFYEKPQYEKTKYGKRRVKANKADEAISEDIACDDDIDAEVIAKLKFQEEEDLRQSIAIKELEDKRNKAAGIIQRYFLRYQLRKSMKRRYLNKLMFYGMLETPIDPEKPNYKLVNENFRKIRRDRKKEFDQKFLEAMEDEKAKILKLRSPFIMEDISDDIRQWFQEFYKGAHDFDRYPEAFEGGTILVVRGETNTVEEFLVEKEKKPEQKAKEKKAKKKAKKEAKQLAKKMALVEKKLLEAKKNLEMRDGKTWDFSEKQYVSKAFVDLEQTFADYEREWKFIDELENKHEVPIKEWITIESYAQVHQELRLIVDDFMRVELELLRLALSKDMGIKYTPAKTKKPKKEKKKKKKEVLDVTEDRSLKECYDELKDMNIIRIYKRRSLDDFIGDTNYAAHELRLLNKDPAPCYGDIRNVLRTQVLGMGPLELPKVRSLCIAGPPKSGKKLLIKALCSEMDAVLFDMSPININKVQDMNYFISLVNSMARKLQPSVLFIDEAHLPYAKKVSDIDMHNNPRKIGQYLIKSIVKKITKDDLVMLMATTNEPWNCNFGKLNQTYDKIYMLPPIVDYNTTLMTWNKGLQDRKIYHFDATTIAQLTRKYTTGDILDIIEKHLNLRRRMKLPVKPLTCQELLEYFLTGPHAKVQLNEKAIKDFTSFGIKIDKYSRDRADNMNRMQILIDKEKEVKENKKAAAAKKQKQNQEK